MKSVGGEITQFGVRKQKFGFIFKMLKEKLTLILWSSSFVGATINI